MNCWKCKKSIEELEKISFKSICPHCNSDLHVCKNCKYFAEGKPNSCLIPNTEWVSDREKFNFCEDFSIKNEKNTINESKFSKLFGKKPLQKDFEDLFEDEEDL